MLIKWSRGNAPSHVAQHFDLAEFECKCNKCIPQQIESELLTKLDSLRELVGHGIIVTSGFRCAEHNKASGGVKNSQHLSGKAADLCSSSVTIEELSKLAENFFQRIGVAKDFVHVDCAPGKASWVYK